MRNLIHDLFRIAPGTEPQPALKSLLRKTQRLSREELDRQQMARLQWVIEYATKHTEYYRKKFGRIRGKDVNVELIRSLPILTKSDILQHSEQMTNRYVVEAMRPIGKISTSGSTGTPLETERPKITAAIYSAIQERFHDWGARDGNKKMAFITAIHHNIPEGGVEAGPWRYKCKPCGVIMSLSRPLNEQLRWLAKENPSYLSTYPSNAIGLIELSKKEGIELPALEDVILSSERIPEDFADKCREVWGARTTLTYSANEMAAIALGHKDHGGYLVQSEVCYVEVVDEAGETCGIGKPGRVLVTTLHDGWRPLIRYEIGDYAEFGEPHEGMPYPVISRVMGRERNLLTLPDGKQIWPIFPIDDMRRLPVRQWQFIQTSTKHLRARVIANHKMTASQESEFRKMVNRFIPTHFDVSIEYVDYIERSKTLKFEDFINRV
jgi:phenylacetate-CoA ligase